MPWNKVNLVEQRLDLIEQLLMPGANISQLCQAHNISRKTAYKWLKRYHSNALEGLKDQSKARLTQPLKTPRELEILIVKTHKAHPYWGPRKLKNFLAAQDSLLALPSVKTVAAILSRNNCEVIKSQKSHSASRRFERPFPNDLWQMDFKGSYMLARERCYPLTIIDDYSRYSLGLSTCHNEKTDTVKNYLITRFKAFGLPNQINVDNGNPWGKGNGESYTKLAVWLIKLGVRLSHSAPYHPQTNGKNERFHRTLKLEVLHERTYKDFKAMQSVFDKWRHIYNYSRPHDALDGQTPSSRYQRSDREYREATCDFDYDKNDIVRKVHESNGNFRFEGRRYRAGKGLCGEYIAIRETANPNEFSIFFMDTFIKKLRRDWGVK